MPQRLSSALWDVGPRASNRPPLMGSGACALTCVSPSKWSVKVGRIDEPGWMGRQTPEGGAQVSEVYIGGQRSGQSALIPSPTLTFCSGEADPPCNFGSLRPINRLANKWCRITGGERLFGLWFFMIIPWTLLLSFGRDCNMWIIVLFFFFKQTLPSPPIRQDHRVAVMCMYHFRRTFLLHGYCAFYIFFLVPSRLFAFKIHIYILIKYMTM